MKANEFRIGNYINLIHEDATGVVAISYKALGFLVEDEVLFNQCHAPIEITEEWLLLLGFENEARYRSRYWKGINGAFFCFQFFKNGRIDFWRGQLKMYDLTSRKYNPIQYVHQLQNLYFSLTGEELKTNL